MQELGEGRYAFAREAVVVDGGGGRADQDETNDDEDKDDNEGEDRLTGRVRSWAASRGRSSKSKYGRWMECVYPDSRRPIGQALALRCEPVSEACQLPVARYTPEPCHACLDGQILWSCQWQSRRAHQQNLVAKAKALLFTQQAFLL